MIDLRSDTLTKPNRDVIIAMTRAAVGDDCYGEDPSTVELESYCCELFGKEAAVFMVSGTMSNQVAAKSFIGPGNEIVADVSAHINFFESAQLADLSRISLNLISTDDGILNNSNLDAALASKARWGQNYAYPGLIWTENTICARGGRVVSVDKLKAIKMWAQSRNIPVFMDGARLLNASAATGNSPREFANQVDGLTVCFSKGLGAPFGSMLLGSDQNINLARKFRKWYGGGLHQCGYLAAAALHVIKYNRDQLFVDNANATILRDIILQDFPGCLESGETNIILMNLESSGFTSGQLVDELMRRGVLAVKWRDRQVRLVTSSRVTQADCVRAGDVVTKSLKKLSSRSCILAA